MSELLDYMRKGYSNPDFEAVKEWISDCGFMGVYKVKVLYEAQKAYQTYVYTAILTNDGKFWHTQHGQTPMTVILEDAAIIANFANANEI